MTDRTKGCWVAFDKDIRVDDVEWIINAIKMIKGVTDVELSITDSSDWINRAHIKAELKTEIINLYNKL